MRKMQFQCLPVISLDRMPKVRLSSRGITVHFWVIKLDKLICFFMMAKLDLYSSLRASPAA